MLTAANESEGVVVAEGGGAGLDRSFDNRHLRDAVSEVAAKRILQEAAHVLALLDAAGNALTEVLACVAAARGGQ